MSRNARLAAVVAKTQADRAIASLKEEGCYDSDRRIRQAGQETLEIPLTTRPNHTSVREVRQQANPDWRVRGLNDRLRRRGFSRDERARAPGSWAVLGDVILARFEQCPREQAVGETLLELHRSAETVLATEGIAGAHREPEVRVIAGTGETETVHVEHGTTYAMDLAQVMFSPGNKAERARMGDVVTAGEDVFDMFAGIGYFTLPMARAGANVVATERNPAAYRYLRENVARNDVRDRVDPYRVDCRALRPRADRIVMGHYDATACLHTAVHALRPGGTIHLHDVASEADRWTAVEAALERAAGDRSLTVRDRRTVKTHSPGMVHVVVDAALGEESSKRRG